MKINKLILSAGIFAVALTGCTDLNTDVESQYTSIPSTPAATEANMANIYFQMRDCLGRRYMEAMTLSSDEYTSLSYSGNWVDSYAYAHTAYHDFTYEQATIDWMGVLGRAIVNANEVIDNSTDTKYTIPARAMRAFYTFLIMDNFGDSPIVDKKYAENHPNVTDFDIEKRQPRKLVAEWLEEELKAVIADKDFSTEPNGENYGKPNKYMAEALLAKIYLNWAVYTCDDIAKFDASTAKNEKLTECINVCNDIISSGKFDIGLKDGLDEYRFKFNYDNTERVEAGTIKDFIYVMPYDTYTAQGMQWGRSHVYKDIKNMKPSYFGEKLNNSGGAYMTLTPECVNRFYLPGDQRNWMIAGLCDSKGEFTSEANGNLGQVYVYDPTTLLPTETKALDKDGNPLIFTKSINITGETASVDVGDNLEGWRQGYRSMKWFVCDRDYSNGRHQSNDVPIFRYADILLTKAEAIVRNGGSVSEAASIVNDIRKYAKVDLAWRSLTTVTLDDIYMERGREFFDELWRKNDMIRFGHYEDNYFPFYNTAPYSDCAKKDTYRRIFPVSKSDLDVNPKWDQNAGYPAYVR